MNERIKTHINEPIDTKKELSGYSRIGWKAPPEVQQRVLEIILEEGRALGFSNADIAYYLAIVMHESGFNPDAANAGSTASGVSQVIDDTRRHFGADDAHKFDARASIKAGLLYVQHLQKKTINDYGSADGKYRPLIYLRYHYGEFSTKRLVTRKPETWAIRPLSEFEGKPKYLDALQVIDVALQVEKILNGIHGLKIRLEDLYGVSLPWHKMLVAQMVKKTPSSPKTGTQPSIAAEKTKAMSLPSWPNSSMEKPARPSTTVNNAAKIDTPPTVNAQVPPTQASSATIQNGPGSTSTQQSTVGAIAPGSGAAPDTEDQQRYIDDSTKQIPNSDVHDAPSNSSNNNVSSNPDVGTTDDNHSYFQSDEFEIVITEVMTDAFGHIPPIVTATPQPFLLLIPRRDYAEYNDAVASGAIQEDGNQHNIIPNDNKDDTQAPAQPEQSTSTQATVAPPLPPPTPSTPTPVSAQPPLPAPPKPAVPATQRAAATSATRPPEKPTAAAPPQPHPGHKFSLPDVFRAIKEKLGWTNVYGTSFSYIKQFQTQPQFSSRPLSELPHPGKGEPKTQVIKSSLPSNEAKAERAKDKVTTAKDNTATKSVEVTGAPKWMATALAEQKKDVHEVEGTQANNAEWKKANNTYQSSISAIKKIKSDLKKAVQAKAPPSAIEKLERTLKEHENARDEADRNMRIIEEKYNDPNIVKYLSSTTTPTARDDSTAWCSSFTNWCLKQSGYKGTDNAGADSWLNWGKKLDEPKYGAITVVTRAKVPVSKQHPTGYLYHVGFFVGFVDKNVADGFEEVKVVGKNGEEKVTKKKKYKKVKYITLLSGNFSRTIREFADWAVDKEDNEARHLVSYRWPE